MADIVEQSEGAGDIVQSQEVGGAMLRLRKFMFQRVYLGSEARREQERVHKMMRGLFEHYVAQPDLLPPGEGGDQPAGRGLSGWDDGPVLHCALHRACRAGGVAVLSWARGGEVAILRRPGASRLGGWR